MLLQLTGWSADWINLAQDSENWSNFVNTLIKLRVAENGGNSLNSVSKRHRTLRCKFRLSQISCVLGYFVI
jgi:hypothetical protein